MTKMKKYYSSLHITVKTFLETKPLKQLKLATTITLNSTFQNSLRSHRKGLNLTT